MDAAVTSRYRSFRVQSLPSIMNILFCFVTIVIVLQVTQGALVKTPKGVIANIGQQVVFECATNNTDSGVDWLFTGSRPHSTEQEIYIRNRLDKTGKYQIHTPQHGHSNLQITSVNEDSAGSYKCHDDFSRGTSAKAELVVLPDLPACQVCLRTGCIPVISESCEVNVEPFSINTENETFYINCNFALHDQLHYSAEWSLLVGAIFPKNETIIPSSNFRTVKSFVYFLPSQVAPPLRINFNLKISSDLDVLHSGTPRTPSLCYAFNMNVVKKTTTAIKTTKTETTRTTKITTPPVSTQSTSLLITEEQPITTTNSKSNHSVRADSTDSRSISTVVSVSITEGFAPETSELRQQISRLYIILGGAGGLILIVVIVCFVLIMCRVSRTSSVAGGVSTRELNGTIRSEYLHSPSVELQVLPATAVKSRSMNFIPFENNGTAIYSEINPELRPDQYDGASKPRTLCNIEERNQAETKLKALYCSWPPPSEQSDQDYRVTKPKTMGRPNVGPKYYDETKSKIICNTRPPNMKHNNYTGLSIPKAKCTYLSIVDDKLLYKSVPDFEYENAEDVDYAEKRKKIMLKMESEEKEKINLELTEEKCTPPHRRSCPTITATLQHNTLTKLVKQ